MTPGWIHASFCGAWAITATVFFVLGVDAEESQNTTLARFELLHEVPNSGSISFGTHGIDVDPVTEFNRLGSLTNDNIDKLEASIRHTAKLSFWLDLISFLAALMGLLAQASTYVYETRNGDKPKARRSHRIIPTEPLNVASGIESQIQHPDSQPPKRVRQPRKHVVPPAGKTET